MAGQEWEYRIEAGRGALARFGTEGWELVSVCVVDGVETFYLKRPRPSIREEITLEQRDDLLRSRNEGDA